MQIDVRFLPADLGDAPVSQMTVVVFDVLRATSSITAALSVGVENLHAFAGLEEAKMAAEQRRPRPVLCGEIHTLPPPGFDLGNSPGAFTSALAGREIFLATTNGTKALAAARHAAKLFAGALINARAVAEAAAKTGRDILLLCSGTDGQVSLEDVLGAGAVADEMLKRGEFSLASDRARIAVRLFQSARNELPAVLRDGQGGRNIIRAKLEEDIDFCARLSVTDVVGVVDPELVIRKL